MAETPQTLRRTPFRPSANALAVVKAQIHAGGRGKGTIRENSSQHGVQVVHSADEALQAASNLLGHTLVTLQTGPEGQMVRRVLVEEGAASCGNVRAAGTAAATQPAALMACREGGMDIEEVAPHPEKILKVFVTPLVG